MVVAQPTASALPARTPIRNKSPRADALGFANTSSAHSPIAPSR